METIPSGWLDALSGRLATTDLRAIDGFVEGQRQSGIEVYPPAGLEFEALRLTPFNSVRAVILGQDPYSRPGQACGLAFSVPSGVDRPLSLRRILAKLEEDLGFEVPHQATLEPWTRHGVLLLNIALTVEAGRPNSHRREWDRFSTALLESLAAELRPIVFLLWGANAMAKRVLVDRKPHIVIESAHPASRLPHSDSRSFAASHPFRTANVRLQGLGEQSIDWALS